MIELHTMVPAFGLPTYTPFGLKVMIYLRMNSLPFRMVVEHNPGNGPKGKFPWIVDDQTVVSDSGFILDYLEEQYDTGFDRHLSPSQAAHAHALRRMVEESLCFSISYFRWVDDASYRVATDAALIGLPWPVRNVLRPMIRRRILRDLRGQGVLRHTSAGVAQLGGRDIDALATHLGTHPFMMGSRPCSLDATAAAFLAVLLDAPFDNALAQQARAHGNLVRYLDNMRSSWSAETGEAARYC